MEAYFCTFLLKKVTVFMVKTMVLSASQEMILDCLSAAAAPLTAYEILGQLQASGVRSPPTVYRALEWLQKFGFIHRIESLAAYVPCKHKHHGADGCSATFAICSCCGAVQELCGSAVTETMKKVSAPFLVQIDRKVIELTGLCVMCTKGKRGRRRLTCST